jgi:hypothetical protein
MISDMIYNNCPLCGKELAIDPEMFNYNDLDCPTRSLVRTRNGGDSAYITHYYVRTKRFNGGILSVEFDTGKYYIKYEVNFTIIKRIDGKIIAEIPAILPLNSINTDDKIERVLLLI